MHGVLKQDGAVPGQVARTGAGLEGADELLPIGTPRRWARSVVTVLVLAVIATLLSSIVRNDRFQWGTVRHYFGAAQVLHGLLVSLQLTAIVMALSIPLSLLVAGMRLSSVPLARSAAWGFVWFFRSVPALVQLLFWFNLAALYPRLSFGLPFFHEWGSVEANQVITPWMAAIVGLTLHEVAFMSEIMRSAIQSVPRGQSEAGAALGMPPARAFWHVILPQATRTAIPPVAGQAIALVKLTALVSFIGLTDLLYSVQKIYAVTYETVPLLLVATLWYLIVTSLLSVVQYYLERHFARGHAFGAGNRARRGDPRKKADDVSVPATLEGEA
jgi:polar amino acid transport system permease protein